jgi:DnaJ family protein C protein 28
MDDDNPVENQISDAMERGDFDNLPGVGKPLRLEHDRLVPMEYRLAYRIMRDNDVQPDWIVLQREIDQLIQRARDDLGAAVQNFLRVERELADKPGAENVRRRLRARDARDEALGAFRACVPEINKKIALFNLKVPAVHLTRDLLDESREIRRFFS